MFLFVVDYDLYNFSQPEV